MYIVRVMLIQGAKTIKSGEKGSFLYTKTEKHGENVLPAGCYCGSG